VSTILIGVDSTARSEDAIALGRDFARAGAAEVVVATVTPSSDPNRDEAHLTVRRMSGLLAGVPPERIRTGVVAAPSPAHGLHELAEHESAALFIVGSTHTGSLGRVRPGSTGERLLSGAPCAVAVPPHGYRTHAGGPIERIGAAWDGSTESRAALAAAIGAASAFGAELEIVTVVASTTAGAPALMTGPGWVTVYEDVENDVRRELDEVVAATAELVETEGVVLHGRPWSELAERSAQLDLLFVGSRAYGPAHAVLAGGTSGPLMLHAHCPVIVLPRDVDTPVVDLFDAMASPA
jgi:nucleotide-binding universal stress UspA family protein